MAGETLRYLVLWCRAELTRELGMPVTLHQLALRSFGRVDERLLRAIVNGQPEIDLTERELEGLALALDLSRWRIDQAARNS